MKERSQRIYDKYGTLMLQTDGMTPEGLERKATCRWGGVLEGGVLADMMS